MSKNPNTGRGAVAQNSSEGAQKSPSQSGSAVGNAFFGLGMFISLLSGGLIVTYIGEIITGTTRHGVSSQLGLIVFLAGIVFVGYKMMTRRLNEHNALKELREEQAILTRAKARGGIITVSETALASQMRIADIKKAFERLASTSVCQIDVTEDGEICYRFPSFESKSAVSKPALMMDTTFDTIELSNEKIQLNLES